MLLTRNTYKEQTGLAEYCKTGNIEHVGIVDKTRVIHYRRLVFNVVKDSLNSAYPLTRNLLVKAEWDTLIEKFFAEHACQSPQIWRMPKELYNYVTETDSTLLEKYIVLKDLLWFEWLEVELYMHEDIESPKHGNGNLESDRFILNPEHILEQFEYPVHIKKAGEIKNEEKGQFYLAMHRHPETGKVLFSNLSPAYVRVLELLNEAALDIHELSIQITKDFGLDNVENVKKHIAGFLNTALKNKLILGYAK